jgi:tetratricopeptide (TPR) repeat protein
MKLKTLGLGLLAAGLLAACDSPLDTNPSASIPANEALDTPEELAVAVNGLYDAYQDNGIDFGRNLLVYPDLYAGNLDFFDTYVTDEEVFTQDVTSTNGGVGGLWRGAYDGINRANEVLAALPTVDELDPDDAAQFRGEALFVRAHMYFILGQFFGGVPLVETPTRTIPTPAEAEVARATLAQTYALVERDLVEARGLLGDAPFNGRAGYYAATALLARLNLYTGDYGQAHDYADEVIEDGPYSLVSDYAANWRNKNGPESILEVQYTVNDPSSFSGWFHYQGRYSFAPSGSLASSYEEEVDEDVTNYDDERYNFIVAESPDGAAYVGKYFRIESSDDDFILLRLAEMYLIRSEASARLGNLADAIADINVIRNRSSLYDGGGELVSGLGDLPADVDTEDEVLFANLMERRREFALEGHWFFDLRRLSDVPAVADLGLLPGEDFRLLFPIPQSELDSNALLTQNTGY